MTISNNPDESNPLIPELVNLFGSLDGEKILGGCEICNAYQMVEPISEGVWTINTYHDDWCPDAPGSYKGP